jgi:uncharacterized protein YbdZ (MbtH family)
MTKNRRNRHGKIHKKPAPRRSIQFAIAFLVVLVVFALSWSLWPRLTGALGLPSGWTITPEQKAFIGSASDLLDHLEKDGLDTVKQIGLNGGSPFVFILKPAKTTEITDEDISTARSLAGATMEILETRGGFRDGDIDLAFHRPINQRIILIRRTGLPEAISENHYGEFTLAVDKAYVYSIINFAGPLKTGRRDYATAWSVIQALCLGYTTIDPGTDAKCNILSANAAAGWVGIEVVVSHDDRYVGQIQGQGFYFMRGP